MTIGRPTETDVILVGMHRPTPDFMRQRPSGVFVCQQGCHAWTHEQAWRCLSGGHYDQPIYCSLQELIAAGWQPKEGA